MSSEGPQDAEPGGGPSDPLAPSPYPPGPPTHWTTAPPRPLSEPTLPVRPKARHGWLVALITVIAIVLLALLLTLAAPSLSGLQAPGHGHGTVRPGSPGTAKPGSPKPSPTPTRTMPTDPLVLLKKNPVYALTVRANCPAQRPPTSRAAFRSQVNSLVACENAAWKKALAKTPVTFAKPKVTFYATSRKSPCGRLGVTFPAAYCTSDRTLYFSTAAYTEGRYYRLAVAQFVMHEYSHHIQELAGIFDSSWALHENASTTSRRIELQAHCMAHYQLTHSGLGFTSRDRADAEFQFGYTNDAKGHGSTTAERYWGRRGLAASTIGACNTWSAKASRVK